MFKIHGFHKTHLRMTDFVRLVDDVMGGHPWPSPVERNQYVTGPQVASAAGPGAAGLYHGLGLKQ